ncbi:MAG: pilus assembly protein N-terminal domain-containing protein [Alphaproteobacteria bacterium]|nr:pilus assembly protein N-terminal domain-containing protein [Alphaproteobacteria bacterium]
MLKYVAPIVALLAGAATVLPTSDAFAQEDRSDWLDIELGKSIVLETPRIPKAISITNPDIADVVQLGSPTKWQIQGASIGTTDLVIQFGGDVPPMIYEITVHQDLSDLVRRIDSIVPQNPPRVYPLGDHIVVEGAVSDLDTLERVAMISRMYDEEFVNLMTVKGDHQVQLEVIYAEVSRSGLRQMGVNIFWNAPSLGAGLLRGNFANKAPLLGEFATTEIPLQGETFNLYGLIAQGINVGAVLNILDRYGLAKVISQPTLVSLSGQKAEFLAGGEVPVIVPGNQGFAQVQYREFGTRMMFIPTVLANDLIDVQIDLELSSIDDAVGTSLRGTVVPGFNARKVRGHVRLKSGMTFAIAGLLSETTSFTRDEFPGLGRIPIIGALFRSVKHEREEIEVLVYVTPRLVRPMAPGEVPAILGTTENNNPSDLALFLLGMDHRPKSRTAAPTGEVGLQR